MRSGCFQTITDDPEMRFGEGECRPVSDSDGARETRPRSARSTRREGGAELRRTHGYMSFARDFRAIPHIWNIATRVSVPMIQRIHAYR